MRETVAEFANGGTTVAINGSAAPHQAGPESDVDIVVVVVWDEPRLETTY